MSHDRHRRPSSSSDVPDRAFTPGRGGRPGGARRSDLVYAGVRPPAGRAEVQRQAAVSSPSIDPQEIEALRQEADASFAAVFERIGPDDGRGQDQVVAPAPARVSSGAMPSAGTAPVQRKAVVNDMDAPKADSIREERATIDPDRGPAAPAARGKGRLAAGGLRRQDVAGHTRGNNAGVVRDTDAPKADSIREERATIEPDADSDAAGPLSPKQAAHAVSRNRHTTAVYRVRPADLDTSAAPDTPAFAQAAARFQQAHGLAVDGIVGPKTTKALHAAGRHQDAHTASQARSAASAVPTKAGQNRQTDVLEDGVLGTGDVLEDGVLGTDDVLEDGVLGTDDVLEDGVLGPDDVLEDGVLGTNDVLEDGLIGQDDPLFARGRNRQQPATRSDQLESGLIDEAVQRKAAGEPSPTLTPMPNTDVPAIAGAGVSGGGQPLPYLQRIQASFGDHDVTGVQAHIGGAAGDAAKQIGALAYATGDHVAFDGAPDLHTAAHEAAHVVQQQHGVQLKGGVGQVGDAHEQHADAVADKVVRGESAEALLDPYAGRSDSRTGHAIQRKAAHGATAQARAEDHDAFAPTWNRQHEQAAGPDGSGDLFSAARGGGQTLGGSRRGQAGYGAQLLGASADAARADADWGALARPVVAPLATLDHAIEAQNDAVQRFTASIDGGFFSRDPEHIKTRKQHSADWAAANATGLERHKMEMSVWCSRYNAWVPLANLSHRARAELVEAAGLLGFGGDQGADFVKALEVGLDRAIDLLHSKAMGKHQDTSWDEHVGHHDRGVGPEPRLHGAPMGPQLARVKDAYNELQASYYAIYNQLLEVQKRILQSKAASVHAKIADINQTIAFWTNMASGVASHAGQAKSLATGKTGAALEAKYDAVGRHGRGRLSAAGRMAEKNPKEPEPGREPKPGDASYQPSDDALAMKDFEDYQDTWAAGGADASPEASVTGGGASFPSLSVGGVVNGALSVLAADKLSKLESQLTRLQHEIGSKSEVQALMQTKEARKQFKTAQKKLAEALAGLKQGGLEDRQADMVDLGDSLDLYAYEHRAGLAKHGKADLVAADGREMFTTLMAVMAKVEQYRSLSAMATGTFDYDECVATFDALVAERTNREVREAAGRTIAQGYKYPPQIPALSGAERGALNQITGTYLTALKFDERWRVRLGGVEQRMRVLLKKLRGLHGTKHAAGGGFY